MYKLDNSFARGHFTVTVVGCGGTGGFVAESLCRLLPERADLVLIDHDRVEERNLIRQNFTREDLGEFKSETLARRLARKYGRPVAYSTLPVAMSKIELPGLVIGCVDNGLARRDLAQAIGDRLFYSLRSGILPSYQASWWVDAGNGENYGQVVIGNFGRGLFDLENELCLALPLPTIQRLELLQEIAPARDCADIAAQGPTINQAMAALVIEVTRRLIEGTCPWMQLYLDLEAGTLTPVLATPEVAGMKIKRKGGEP